MSNAIEKGLGRLAYQFEESENLKSFLESFLQEFEELRLSNIDLLNERYLNTAVGVQLDGIGEIVGIDRPQGAIDIIGAFGFYGDETARGFGDINNPAVGGNFVSFGSAYELVGDDLYRTVIRAKIIKNQTAMVVDDTTRLISFMFGGVPVRYILNTNLKPVYEIGTIVSPLESFLLDYIPVLIGLEEISLIVMHSDTPFGFADDPTALGFGDINNPAVGGNFAKIV